MLSTELVVTYFPLIYTAHLLSKTGIYVPTALFSSANIWSVWMKIKTPISLIWVTNETTLKNSWYEVHHKEWELS